MAKKATAASAAPKAVHSVAPLKSAMKPGKASDRVKSRVIVLYGAPKVRKTGACSYIKNAKWIITDPNAIPTLDALDRLPHADNTYEVASLAEVRAVILEAIDIAETQGADALGCSCFVLDSLTSVADWHKADVAKDTGQQYMGENPKANGWQKYNSEMGLLIDDLGILGRYKTVILICHAKEKPQGDEKGQWSGLNLSPEISGRMGRTANWVLYQYLREFATTGEEKTDGFITLSEDGKRATEVVINTKPVGLWICSANAKHLDGEEPANMAAILAKEGLLPESDVLP